MKKFVMLFICLAMLTFSAIASANPTIWHHAEYDLSKVQTINIAEIENKNISIGKYTAANDTEDAVKFSLYKAADKYHLAVTEEANASALPAGKPGKRFPKAVNVKITVDKLGYETQIEPAHYESKTKYITTDVYDNKGKKTGEARVPIVTQEYVPESTYHTSYLTIVYNVYDADGTLIFTGRDVRDREGTSDPSGMLERARKDFIKHMLKNK